MSKQRTVDLDPDAHEKLKELQELLPAEGVSPQIRLQDIASALVLFTPPQQAAGMVAAFSRHLAARDKPKG
jgi:hypothetical protein